MQWKAVPMIQFNNKIGNACIMSATAIEGEIRNFAAGLHGHGPILIRNLKLPGNAAESGGKPKEIVA
jgi:hypothetical protein